MGTVAQAKAREKRSQLRSRVFPNIEDDRIWDVKNKAKTKGYTSLPRAMPLMMNIMDLLAGKGKPVSHSYLELWSRTDEGGFIILSKYSDVAFASGYSGERGISTWKERVRRLENLGFISTAEGASGQLHYVQVWNPYLIIQKHFEEETPNFSKKHYNALLERVSDIGAKDLG